MDKPKELGPPNFFEVGGIINYQFINRKLNQLLSNLKSSNTNGSFTMANLNSYVCCVYSLELPHQHSTYHYFIENQKDLPILLSFASWHGAMINPQWLKLPMSWINFHGPKDVGAIEVLLCIFLWSNKKKYFPGPSCSKLTTSLVNDSLKFTSSDMQICWNFLLKKCE